MILVPSAAAAASRDPQLCGHVKLQISTSTASCIFYGCTSRVVPCLLRVGRPNGSLPVACCVPCSPLRPNPHVQVGCTTTSGTIYRMIPSGALWQCRVLPCRLLLGVPSMVQLPHLLLPEQHVRVDFWIELP